ncbi:MAG: NAD(P)(+) transhydrogenase (Re/Si-specific) subunit beta [Janthinobacterium lividum]
MQIGIPAETLSGETRVAATPETVRKRVVQGHRLRMDAGGGIGAFMANKIEMTRMPELVAFMHSMFGLAAVFIGVAAVAEPWAFGITLPPVLATTGAAVTADGTVVGSMAFVTGGLIMIPIGGADVPVVVSMLNGDSGRAAAGIGFSLNNAMLIVADSLVGSLGAVLSYIICKAMNRSFFNVTLGGFGGEAVTATAGAAVRRPVKTGSADVAAFVLSNAETVIGNKRSTAAGYVGLDNELFHMDKTMMVFGDARKVVENMGKSIE